MDREELVRRVIEILSTLTLEQAHRLLHQLETHLWVLMHLGMWDEKRSAP